MIIDESGKERYGCIYLIKAIDHNITDGIYIGQTVDFKARKRCHWRGDDKKNMPISFSIDKYGKENFEMFIIEYCDSLAEMNDAEESYIAYYKSIGARLYNIKRGGNNHTMAEETKRKIGQANKIRDYVPTQAAREAMAASRSNPVISMDLFGNKNEFKSIRDASRALNISTDSIADVANKIRTSTSGYTFIYKKEEALINIKDIIIDTKPPDKRKIYSIDKLGNRLEFNYPMEASKILNVHYGHILEILHNKPGNQAKTIGGYTFVFEDDLRSIDEILLQFIDSRAKAIIAIDLNGNIQKFKSMYKASKMLNISASNIGAVLNGKRQSSKGYIFEYVNK